MTQKSWILDRRTLLKGAGISLALPVMEAMAGKGDQTKLPHRACFMFFPNGVSLPPENHKAHKDWHWFPFGEGKDYTFTRSLAPLAPHRDQISILQGLSHPLSRKIVGHNTADVFLTGADISRTYNNAISIDQIIARETGKETRIPSLVLSSDNGIGYTARTGTLSFNKSGQPIPADAEPRRIFNRLFGTPEGESLPDQRSRLKNKGSMLDYLLEDTAKLARKLGNYDKRKLDEYLTSIREVEQQVDRTEAWLEVAKPHVDPKNVNLLAGTDDPAEFIRTIYDLMVLAFQTDSTRVATYQIAREDSQGVGDKFPQAIGLGGHHGLSHGTRKAEGFERWGKYDEFLSQQFGYFLTKLRAVTEGDATLLDRTMILYGCGTSTTHNANNYPIILAGGAHCGFQHGALHRYTDATPFANTHLTIAQKMGLKINRFADSTGSMTDLVG